MRACSLCSCGGIRWSWCRGCGCGRGRVVRDGALSDDGDRVHATRCDDDKRRSDRCHERCGKGRDERRGEWCHERRGRNHLRHDQRCKAQHGVVHTAGAEDEAHGHNRKQNSQSVHFGLGRLVTKACATIGVNELFGRNVSLYRIRPRLNANGYIVICNRILVMYYYIIYTYQWRLILRNCFFCQAASFQFSICGRSFFVCFSLIRFQQEGIESKHWRQNWVRHLHLGLKLFIYWSYDIRCLLCAKKRTTWTWISMLDMRSVVAVVVVVWKLEMRNCWKIKLKVSSSISSSSSSSINRIKWNIWSREKVDLKMKREKKKYVK